MATVYEVPAGDLIAAAAKDLKENVKFKKPEWADFVKTGSHVESYLKTLTGGITGRHLF